MNLFKKLLAIALALSCVFAITACNNDEETELDTTKSGVALEWETDETDDGNYIVVTGLFVSDAEKYSLTKDTYKTVDLKIGVDGKIVTPVYDEDDKPVYNEDGTLKTEEIALGEEYDGFKIADAAFANQLIIGSVTLASNVVEIGSAAFAGCANVAEMTLPFVGEKAQGAVNAKKVFAYLFGSTEAANCTSVTCNYNLSGSATYYIPTALKKITVAYAAGSVLPEYAFNGVTTLEEIVITGITSVGNSAFAGATGVTKISLPAEVTEIGKSAFSGCSNLINFVFPAELTTVYQEAFKDCVRLGYGKNTVVTLSKVTDIYEKAFYGCTAISAIDLPAVEYVGAAAFYNCSALKSATYSSSAVVGNDAFGNCHEDFSING